MVTRLGFLGMLKKIIHNNTWWQTLLFDERWFTTCFLIVEVKGSNLNTCNSNMHYAYAKFQPTFN